MLAAVLFDRLADLTVDLDGYRTERLEQAVTSGFTRVTTLVTMAGGGHEGAGEDVTYTTEDHDGFPDDLPLSGRHTLSELSALLDGHELFPRPPAQHAYLDYRRWAFESAALDLALRQAGQSLAETVGRRARPVRFVLSTREDVGPVAVVRSPTSSSSSTPSRSGTKS